MMVSYDILFQINIRHNYFKNGMCRAFSLIPDHETQKLIRKYGLIHRETESGIVVLAESKTILNETILSNKIEINLQFNYFLNFKNAYILNITELDEPKKESITFFSNTLINEVDENTNSYSFNEGNHVRLSTKRFIVNKDRGQEGLFTRDGTNIPLVPEMVNEKISYNTNGLDSGIYQFLSKNEVIYFYLSRQTIVSKSFALLNINLNNKSVVNNDGEMQHPVYDLQLKTKETFWQYIVSINQNPNNLIIESSGNGDEFEKSVELISENKHHVTFTSKTQIPLEEEREEYYRLKLRNGDPSNDLILISKLPLPNAGVLNKNVEGKIYTTIYVNF